MNSLSLATDPSRRTRPGSLAAALALILAVLTATAALPAAASGSGPAPVSEPVPEGEQVPAELRDALADEPQAGAAGIAAASQTAKARTGLGLPSYAELLGKRWKAKIRKADARFASRLAEPVSDDSPRRRLLASPPNAVDRFERMFQAKDSVKGSGGKQTRKLSVAASLSGGCPQYLSELGPAWGWIGGGKASYVVTTVEQVKKYELTTSVVFEGRFEARPGMEVNAEAEDFSSADLGEVTITRSQLARDRKTGKRFKVGESERFRSSLSPFYGVDSSSFDEFIRSQEDGAPAPKRVLRSAACKDVAEWFMTIPYEAMRTQVLDAAKLARTPNRCVQLRFDGAPAELAPGQRIELTGTPYVPHDPKLGPLGVLAFTSNIRPAWVNMRGQQSKPLAPLSLMRAGKAWYDFVAPDQTWPVGAPIGLDFRMTSAAGIAQQPITFKPTSAETYLKVIDASFETDTHADMPSTLCGEVGGRRTFTGEFIPNEFSTEDSVTIAGGQIDGMVTADVSARWHNELVRGCTIENGKQPCEKSMPDRTPGDDGLWHVYAGFSTGDSPDEVRVTWAIPDPEVGFFDASDEECNAYVYGNFPLELDSHQIPLTELQGEGPITLTYSGSTHIDKHAGHFPASIDYDWEYSLTVVRVDENGEPVS